MKVLLAKSNSLQVSQKKKARLEEYTVCLKDPSKKKET